MNSSRLFFLYGQAKRPLQGTAKLLNLFTNKKEVLLRFAMNPKSWTVK